MTRIKLYRTPQGWLARFIGGQGEADVRKAFDTDVLPTAFTAQASEQMVYAEIARLNPRCIVEVARS